METKSKFREDLDKRFGINAFSEEVIQFLEDWIKLEVAIEKVKQADYDLNLLKQPNFGGV